MVGALILGLVAGFIGRAVNWYGPEDQGAGFLAAILGAVVILFIYRLVLNRRAR